MLSMQFKESGLSFASRIDETFEERFITGARWVEVEMSSDFMQF